MNTASTSTSRNSDGGHEAWLAESAEREKQKRNQHIADLIRASGVPKRHLNIGTDRTCDAWVSTLERLKSKAESGYLVLLTGERGRGKTQLAVDLIVDRCAHESKAEYVKAMTFFLKVRETYRDTEQSERQVIEAYCRPSLLVIDEVHVRGESRWEDQLLTHLIDRRYDDRTDTILVSNLNKQAFIESVGTSIADRARETGGVIVFDFPSFRGDGHRATAGRSRG